MKRILCFGDSNTWGNISGTADRFDADKRWTGVMQKALGDGYQVIEEGYNGRTTVFDDPVEGRLSGISYFGPCLDSQSPLDAVVLMLGTNDLKLRFGVEAQTIAFGFNRYLDVLRVTPMAGEKPAVLLVAPIWIDASYKNNALFYGMFGDDAVRRSQALSSAYSAFAAAAGIAFLDAAEYAAAAVQDGVHMGAEDHARLGEAIALRVKAMLKA